jgi:hypothetical protein
VQAAQAIANFYYSGRFNQRRRCSRQDCLLATRAAKSSYVIVYKKKCQRGNASEHGYGYRKILAAGIAQLSKMNPQLKIVFQ